MLWSVRIRPNIIDIGFVTFRSEANLIRGRKSGLWLLDDKMLAEPRWSVLLFVPFSVHSSGPGTGQPARRGLHQRPSAAQPHPSQDSRDGPPRDPSVRHLPAAARLPRLRLQDPVPLPGDRLHPARSDRREQAQGKKIKSLDCNKIMIQ